VQQSTPQHRSMDQLQRTLESMLHLAMSIPRLITDDITTCRASPGHVTGQCCERVAVGQ
jgi:hypothetical protein